MNGSPYFVVGTGGKSLYAFGNVLPESQFRYNADYGAMLVDATAESITFEFYNRAAVLIDTYTLSAAVPTSTSTPTPTGTPTSTRTPTATPNATNTPTPTPTTVAIAAPSNLTAQSVSSSQINLSWADNSGNETGFKIERYTNGGSFAQIASVGPNVTQYSNTGLTRGTRYWYRVRAFNASADSLYSNTANARTKQK